jgi:hypothetical protein
LGLLSFWDDSQTKLRLRGFKVSRDVKTGEHKFTDVFSGLDHSPTLPRVFGTKINMLKIAQHLKLRVEDSDWGLWLDRDTGTVCIGRRHVQVARAGFLYLDVVHVLVHVKQFLEGKELYDQTFEYVDRPTELEAYRYTIEEARTMGMNEERSSSTSAWTRSTTRSSASSSRRSV